VIGLLPLRCAIGPGHLLSTSRSTLTKGEVPDGEIVDTLGTAKVIRAGRDATILALALMVPRRSKRSPPACRAWIDCEFIDIRSLVPLDTRPCSPSVAKTHRLFTVEENPRLCAGRRNRSIVCDESFYELDGPPFASHAAHTAASAANLEDSRCRRGANHGDGAAFAGLLRLNSWKS